MSEDADELRERIVSAVRRIPLHLGPNALVAAQARQPILLNFTEAHRIADEVVEILNASPGATPVVPVDAEVARLSEANRELSLALRQVLMLFSPVASTEHCSAVTSRDCADRWLETLHRHAPESAS